MAPSRAKLAAVAATIVIATLAVFAGALPRTFVNFDDNVYVTDNAQVREGLGARGIAWAFTTTAASNWHPLTWLSHMLDVQLFGLDAGKHHLVSLLLHAANAAFLFLLLARMTGALWRSAFAAALFAVHPLHVESFAWVAERKDVLSTALWLATTAAWLRYVRSRTTAGYAAVALLYALGLMAKPMLVTLPFTLLLLDVWPLGRLAGPLGAAARDLARLVAEKVPLFAMAAVSCVVTSLAQRSGGALQDLETFPLSGRLANALCAYVAYLEKTAWPSALAVFYPYRGPDLLSWPTVGSAVALAAVTTLAAALARRAPYAAFGWLWYLGTLVPVIGVVQVGGQSMADRYTYVPLIGIFVAIAWGWAELFGRTDLSRRVGVAAACAWLLVLAAASRVQLGTWADRTILFEHALAVTSDNWLAHGNLGTVLLNAGDTSGAIAHFDEALRIHPAYTEAHYNLGLAMERLGRHAAAIEQFQKAIELRPGFASAHNNLGGVLAGVGRTAEALEEFRTAIRLDPANEKARLNLGNVLLQAGRTSEAIERFREELRLRPGSAAAHNNLGRALARSGRMAEALGEFQEALRLAPEFDEAAANARMARAALGQR